VSKVLKGDCPAKGAHSICTVPRMRKVQSWKEAIGKEPKSWVKPAEDSWACSTPKTPKSPLEELSLPRYVPVPYDTARAPGVFFSVKPRVPVTCGVYMGWPNVILLLHVFGTYCTNYYISNYFNSAHSNT